jgi:uncharacterized protein
MTEIDPSLIVLTETIPGGAYWSGVIKRGYTLRITDLAGSAGVALLCYNADNPIERLNVADTAKIQFNAFLTKGNVLYSDMGRVLFSITEDTSSYHDLGATSIRYNYRATGKPYWLSLSQNWLHLCGVKTKVLKLNITAAPASFHRIPEQHKRCLITVLQAASVTPDPIG